MHHQFLDNPFIYLLISPLVIAAAWAGFFNGRLMMLMQKPDLSAIQDFSMWKLQAALCTGISIVFFPFFKNGQIFSPAELRTTYVFASLVLGVVSGMVTAGMGWNLTTFKKQVPVLLMIGFVSTLIVYWMPFLRYQIFWIAYTFVVISQVAFMFLYFKQVNGKKDVCLIEVPDDVSTGETLKAYNLLREFGAPLSLPPHVSDPAKFELKFNPYQQATLQPGLFPLQVLVNNDGLYLRLTKGLNPESGLSIEDGRLAHRAIWFFIPWENVAHLKSDSIIGHTETRLGLKDSRVQLILEGKSWELKRREALQVQPGTPKYAV